MSSIHLLKKFDRSQLWRFFVDGRFQKKYAGWIGYEASERGSVQAWLNAFAYMLENFNLTEGLQATYLRELHKRAMLNVETANLKSSPGDIRYLNSGMPFFAKSTTYEHLVEVFSMRRGDGTHVFNNKRFSKPADELNVDDVWAYLRKEGTINYRNWYPNLDKFQREALEGRHSLRDFYSAKHAVQMLIVAKMEEIVGRYNSGIRQAKTNDEKLAVIALVPRELELLHPFPDGNSRTFSCITLTHLLMWNNLTPALLKNPNLDNEVSLTQWIDEIKDGQQRFEQLLADPSARVFDFSIGEMALEDREKFLNMAAEVNARLDQFREIYLTPQRLLDYTKGRWLGEGCDDNLRFTGVGTYNTMSSGNIYFAMAIADWIKGGQDPRLELKKIIARGIRALVVDDAQYAAEINIPVLLVKDTFKAFKACATQVRQNLDPFTVLVTGTEGKTGAKVQFQHVLSQQIATHAVRNSANTEVPVLRSLINLCDDHKVEINEVSVGSDEAYRVERTMMVNPDLCFFTNIGPNHMDMHKSLDNIFIAKSSVVEGLRAGGKCIINGDIDHLDKLYANIEKRRAGTPILTYGTDSSNHATLIEKDFDADRYGWHVKARIGDESVNYFLPLLQGHAPLASVGILLAVKEMGYDVQRAARDYQGLESYETMGRILKLSKRSGDVLFYDQSRRGAIEGMRSAFNDIKNLNISGRIIALVGGISIKKDSEWTRQSHRELAELVNKSGIDCLFTTGNFMNYVVDALDKPSIFAKHSNNLDELAQLLFASAKGGDLIFIIGSAYLYLGRVSDRLLKLEDKSLYDDSIENYISKKNKLELYGALVAQAEMDGGMGQDAAVASGNITKEKFLSHCREYPTYTDTRSVMLAGFFSGVDELVSRMGLRNLNQEIKDGGNRNYVHNRDFCVQWFNNEDRRPDMPKKQLFGSFYGFGSDRYLLHIEVATKHLHVGFVLCDQTAGVAKLIGMTDQEQLTAIKEFAHMIKMKPRTWGPRWVSFDYGNFIDLTKAGTFSDMVSVEQGKFGTSVLIPLLQKLIC